MLLCRAGVSLRVLTLQRECDKPELMTEIEEIVNDGGGLASQRI